MTSLATYPAVAVLRADDVDRAARFYLEVLGFTEEPPGPEGERTFDAGQGTMFTIYERPGMPAPQNTTLGFAVPADEFDGLMRDLRSKGVQFEEYDMPEIGLKTHDGVADMGGVKSAWFKDTEGNILNIVTM